jgi:hypothetical protein
MTAEIAVLNRGAVALAADSAVTIGHGASAKTYMSENKLFEISDKKPMGLMIYNHLDFFGYPWEVLVKNFRKEMGSSPCDNVCDWTQCFLDWLYKHHMPTKEQQEEQFSYSVREILEAPAEKVREALIPFLGRKRNSSLRTKIENILPETIRSETRRIFDNTRITNVNKLKAAHPERAKLLDETTLADWLEEHSALVDQIAKEVFRNQTLRESDYQFLRKYVLDVLSRHVYSNDCTGLVFAGFGDKEQFPSLHHVIIDGVIGDKLRCMEGEYYDVDRSENKGTVIPFAQPDVAHRFLYGVDEELENKIAHYFTKAIEGLAPALSATLRIGGRKKALLRDALVSAADAIKLQFLEDASEELKQEFFWLIEDMVRLMPKQEMANLAEALVNITIIKRRASAELETVGGPIDVAVISRHEGFVWVKRKHYFDGRLNPRFFWRMFGSRNPNDEASQDG